MNAFKFLIPFALIVFITFLIARYGLGNPFAGLGSKGFLNKNQVEEMKKELGLSGNPLSEFVTFLLSLPRGGPPSLLYGKPSLFISESYLVKTLIVLIPSFLLASIMASMTALITSFRGNTLIETLAFVPEYLYASLLFISSWTFGWPNPLPETDLSKVVAYSLIVFVVEYPKLFHGLTGLFEDSKGDLEDSIRLMKAIGLSRFKLNLIVFKYLLSPFISLSLYSFAMLLERIVLIEPFINFPGIGELLYTSVVNADVYLAATSFLVVGSLALAIATLSSTIEKLLDVRLRA